MVWPLELPQFYPGCGSEVLRLRAYEDRLRPIWRGAAVDRRNHPSLASESGHDRVWRDNEEFHDALEETHEYERAFEIEEATRRAQAAEMRLQQLSAYAPVRGHYTTDAYRRELEQAGVPHTPLGPPTSMLRASWPAAHQLPAAAGQIGGRPFPTHEQLNLGQPHRFQPAAIAQTFSHRGYEQLRDEAAAR